MAGMSQYYQHNTCAFSMYVFIQPFFIFFKLQHYIEEVKFNIAGEEVNFDLKGDSVPYYDIINWQKGTSGNIEFVNVGLFDGTKAAGEELVIYEDKLTWAGHQREASCSHCVFNFIRHQLLKFCRLRLR